VEPLRRRPARLVCEFVPTGLGQDRGVFLVWVIALALGVVADIPVYLSSTRIYERRGETPRRSVVLIGHGCLVLALAMAFAAGIDLAMTQGERDAPFSRGAALALLLLGMTLGALGNIIIQRERLKSRRSPTP